MVETSEIELLVSPCELSLPLVAVGCRRESEDAGSVVGSYVVNGDNNIILPSEENRSQNTHSVSFDLMANVVNVGSLQDTMDREKSRGDGGSLFSSRALLDGIVLPSPKADHSNEAESLDAKIGVHVAKFIDLLLPQRIINSSVESPRLIKEGSFNRRIHIDIAAPFEYVKEAVSKFGLIVDWKAHKVQSIERRKLVDQELDKMYEELPEYKKRSEGVEEAKIKVLKELENTKRLVEEMKLSLERAQTEENQAKQDSELAKLRMQEMKQGIANEASVAAKTQLEEQESLMIERDITVKKAKEAVSASKEFEKMVEDLSIELITTKEVLESAHVAHLEAEERRITVAVARDQYTLRWKKDLKLEVDSLKATVRSLKSELEKEKSKLEKTQSEATIVQPGKMTDLPKELQQAAQEAEKAKSFAQMAREALCKAKEEAEQAKGEASSIESRLLVTQKETEAAKVSKKLALAAIKALQASESAHNTNNVDSSRGATFSIEEYYDLNKRAYEFEAQINTRMAAVKSRIEVAKQSQSKSLEKLEDVNKEMSERMEAQRIAMERAEKAKQGKLSVEQELRDWRAQHEQQRMATESNRGQRTPSISLEEYKETNNIEPARPPADPSAKTNNKFSSSPQPSFQLRSTRRPTSDRQTETTIVFVVDRKTKSLKSFVMNHRRSSLISVGSIVGNNLISVGFSSIHNDPAILFRHLPHNRVPCAIPSLPVSSLSQSAAAREEVKRSKFSTFWNRALRHSKL
ncbi:Protein WEAK CHLOROPLAST MOVEMENT UNDER BLUE LIGHT 1 [Hibiscus syriacus]|uniref:Protein WEAK CHLOROPLAST MOVEMENT UNDER BLUE LIGHT 1 n=1 Tax=Hibiscus syriacus TaxID=106335 RepID=A0A6A2YGH6_HIBSY|nr:Protein WEAK CHLOROPLAST MOVEMENT UNDER BLUE LIGHT 1 [Hibiscus syriacus]